MAGRAYPVSRPSQRTRRGIRESIRDSIRDPNGHLIEVGQRIGLRWPRTSVRV